MTRSNPIQGAFNAGELSERLHARLDFNKYKNGAETCINLLPLAEGGLMRRSGSRYIAAEKSSSVKGRIKRFQFSTTQAYIVELGNQIFRFYRHQGQITAINITASITNGTFASGIANWTDRSGGAGAIAHDSTNLRLSLNPGGTAATDIANAEQQVTNSSALAHTIKFRVYGAPGNLIDLQVGTSAGGTQILSPVKFEVGFHCYTFTTTAANFFVQFRSLGTYQNKVVGIDDISLIDNTGVEIDTPYTEAQLYQVNGPQSADVLYLHHPSHPVYKLQRLAHTSWSLVEVAWIDGPYLIQNTTSTTLLPSAASGLGINLTLSAVTGVNDDLGWQSTDVGRSVRYQKGGSGAWGYAVIVSITSTLVAVADVRENFQTSPATSTAFRLGAWSGTTGYPSAATFYQQRLLAANTANQPQTWWGTQTADFENHTPDNLTDTVEDDDALDYTISADDVDAIRWLSAGKGTLAIGTVGGEWTATSIGAVVTPSDVVVDPATSHGSADIKPLRIGNIVLFVQRAKRKLREFGFDFAVDGYQAFDMTRLSEQVTRGGIVEMDYAEEPNGLVWTVRSDGQMPSMTFRREEDVVGWARHIVGGSFLNDDTAISQVWQYDASADSFVDETTDANDTGNADWTLFPATEAIDDYAAFGYTKAFTQLKIDYANGTAGIGGAVDWEYWNGSAWVALTGVTDGTTGFTATAADGLTVTWTLPTDWATLTISAGAALYYVRAQIKTVYTTNPVLDQGFVQDISDAVVESVAVIPGANGSGQIQNSETRDEVWLTVKRTINGAVARYVEMLEVDWDEGFVQEDAYYSDSLITYDGTAASTMTGLDHLEGQTVKVLADGAVHPDRTVASGSITLDSSYQVVQMGLAFTHTLKTLKILAGTTSGTPLGKNKQIFGLTFTVLNSHTLTFGPDATNLRTIDFRKVADAMDTAVPPFTGEHFEEWDDDWNTDPRMVIQSSDPTPFSLLALAPEIDTREVR
jgi:hypothetical protein